MELRDNPDHITAADVGNVTILDRGWRRGICPKGQRGKAEKARSDHEPQERPPMTLYRSGEAAESIHPDVALPSPHHLPRYWFLGGRRSRFCCFRLFHCFVFVPALPFSLLRSFSSSASACCSTSNSTCAASCAIIFSSLFSVSSGLNSGARFHFHLLATFVRMRGKHRERRPEQE